MSSESTLKNFSMDAAPGNLPLHRPIPVTRPHPSTATAAVGTAIDGFSSTYLHSSFLDALSSCSIDNNHLTTNNNTNTNNTYNTNNFPSTNYTHPTIPTYSNTTADPIIEPTQVISRQHSRSIDNGKGGPGTDFPGANHLKDMFDFDFEEEEEEVDTEVFI